MLRPRSLPYLASALLSIAALLVIFGCSDSPPKSVSKQPAKAPGPRSSDAVQPLLLGVDVLEADGFAAVKGKRIALLTHPAGVNRRGESTIDVLRRAPQTRLVSLFAPEHGLYGTEKAAVNFDDSVDARTGLPVYSLHGYKNRKPSAAQLKNLDAVVVDLQDIGVRAYTFSVVMRYVMDSCFTAGVEVIVLDRPNPLGGLKVDGPTLDREWRSGVGQYSIPYVHGLTMGELARLAAGTPGGVDVPEVVRLKGKLTVVPMQGWRRSMRWPETGLNYVPTSQYIRDFESILGFAMVGLGCEYSDFRHGLGTPYPFRLITFKNQPATQLEADLRAEKLEGISFRQITTTGANGKAVTGVLVEVTDWEKWNPTDLSFSMMRLACRYNPPNPFARLGDEQATMFNKHVGSSAWWTALKRDGARVDVEAWRRVWRTQAQNFQEHSKQFWLYQ